MAGVTLTPEQRATLLAFSLQHGRYWKSELQRLWMSGKDVGHLRQIRNDFGPQWLKNFQF